MKVLLNGRAGQLAKSLAEHATGDSKFQLVTLADYIFDGEKPLPYDEADATGPLNVYSQSKLEGEGAVMAAHPRALVLRTSWVFSPFGSNFVMTMPAPAVTDPCYVSVNDQVGNPTSALELASAILWVVPKLWTEPGGIYHFSGVGSTNWHDFAALIFEQSRRLGGPAPTLEGISSSEYKTAARRPANSRLDCSAFSRRFGVSLCLGQETVEETVAHCLAS